MKLRVTRYPNNETRMVLYPERFPKSLDQLCSKPEESSLVSSSPPLGAFNIKSKVDTVPRTRRLALSRYGRRQILRSGSCFDEGGLTERLLLTGTLPGTGNRAHRALAEYSSYASKTLTNWLTRRSPGCAWMYTWEFQGRGALHIHLVVEVPVSVSSYIKVHFKDEWNRILRAICRLSGTDLYAKTAKYSHSDQKTQADVTICTKAPSRYISKYITKSKSHAKAFGRFPPKTWYQVSRSLLSRLRAQTQTYEIEGLDYRQSLNLIEDFSARLDQFDLAGHRRFQGSVLSWHGYVYYPTFNPGEWSHKLMNTKQALLPSAMVANQIRSAVKTSVATQLAIRKTTHPRLYEYMDRGMLSETELLMYIETATRSLALTWKESTSLTLAASMVRMGINWWENKFINPLFEPDQQKQILSECEDFLTTGNLGTKVEGETKSPFQQLKLFCA